MKLLIADDDPIARSVLERTLRDQGHEPLAVADGNEALATLSAPLGPGLALLDWEMPGLDGPELCARLRGGAAPEHPLYLILVTGRTNPSDIADGLNAGADDYVVKPVHPVELAARVRVGERVLALQGAVRERERFQGALEMAGAVCHEFNQPLQVVRGWTDLLLEDLADDHPDARALREIGESVERLGQLTQKLMGLTRYRSKDYMAGRSRIIDLHEASRP